MDSILISPKDDEELEYVLQLLKTLEIVAQKISEKDKDDFELANLMKDVDVTGIVREESKAVKLSVDQIALLVKSEKEISGKTFVTEKQIQVDEDEWLSK
jgi:hypothetical protein